MSSRNPQHNRRPPARPPNTPVLRVAVQGSEIVVSASGTDDYVVKYHKPANSPQLLARSFPRKEDSRVSLTLADFLTAAWKLANDKARELGWDSVAFRPCGAASHALRPTRASASEVTRMRPASSMLVPAS